MRHGLIWTAKILWGYIRYPFRYGEIASWRSLVNAIAAGWYTGKEYGLDEYSRYVEVDGERYQIEPWPAHLGWRFRFNLYQRIRARIDILRWYWATRDRRYLWRY